MGRFLRMAFILRWDPPKVGIYHKKGPVGDGKISYDAGYLRMLDPLLRRRKLYDLS